MLLRSAILSLLALLALAAHSANAHSQKKKQDDQESMRPNPAAASVDPSGLASCPAGSPLGEMSLTVTSASGDRPLPFENIIHLTEGDVVRYEPVEHGRNRREGEVALVLVPTKISGKEELLVTDPRSADKPQTWQIPRSMSLAVFVDGPHGLSSKRVRNFLSQDDSLIAQLAEYADKTSQTEALVAALSNSESSSASMNAALTGFASQYGVSVSIDKSAPPAAQAQTLFSALNPQLSSYSPLASDSAGRAGQTASLATAAAGLFFGSPVGLLAGGTSMLLDLRSIAFPDTQFRSSFALKLKNTHMNLCGERIATPPHTRLAYLWASRIPGAARPAMQIGSANYLPVQQKTPLPVTLTDVDWKYLQRARNWALQDSTGHKTPVDLLKLQNQKAVEIDLSKAQLKSGDYQLSAYWDWTPFAAAGQIHVRPLSDLAAAQLQPASQDKLLASGGKVPVTVSGADFEFTTKVEWKKAHDEFAVAEPARFLLPKGLRQGPQTQMDVLLDTRDREPGDYQLLVSQSDDKVYPIPFKLLSNPPHVSNFPILANAGVANQHYVLKGERLDAITRLEAPGATFTLSPVAETITQRDVTVQLQNSAPPGAKLPITAYLRDRNLPLIFPDALEMTGPLPVIASSRLAPPAGLAIALRQDEFPAGVNLSATLYVKNIAADSTLQLGCRDSLHPPAALHIGEQTSTSSLQQLSPDQLYVLFDTNALPAGCRLQAVVDNGRGGKSQPYELARITRLPQVDTFEAPTTAPSTPDAKVPYVLKGKNLEMIEKVGWDPAAQNPVNALPSPIPGEGQKQTLTIEMPPPQTGKDELYLWLRGDKDFRTTTFKPAPPPIPRS